MSENFPQPLTSRSENAPLRWVDAPILRKAANEPSPQKNEESPEPTEMERDEKFASSAEQPLNATGLPQWFNKLLLIFVSVFILSCAGYFLYQTAKLPGGIQDSMHVEFPQKGSFLTATSARTYWRRPVQTGANPDRVKQGTVYLPVIEMKIHGTGCVRLVFRNDRDEQVGDVVTRAVKGEVSLNLAATAGMMDRAEFPPYKIGDTKPWKIEVMEADSVDAAAKDFKPLFETWISANLQ